MHKSEFKMLSQWVFTKYTDVKGNLEKRSIIHKQMLYGSQNTAHTHTNIVNGQRNIHVDPSRFIIRIALYLYIQR